MTTTSSLILSTLTHEIQAIVAALVGGFRYGVKIRVPHAVVMTLLFRRDLPANEKVKTVLKLAAEHASNLAAFASIYKVIVTLLKWSSIHVRNLPEDRQASAYRSLGRALLSLFVDGPIHDPKPLSPTAPPGHAEHAYHSFVAGALGGYFIWGRYSAINYQIVLYLTSRVVVSLWKRLHGQREVHAQTYPLSAALVWGFTMALWEESPETLHPSLRSSMDEIYGFGLSKKWREEEKAVVAAST